MNRPVCGESVPIIVRRAAQTRAWIGIGSICLAAVAWMSVVSTPAAGVSPNSEVARFRVDPNLATKAELMLLPGIGDALSDAIVEYRESRLPERAFRVAADLDAVHRIGPATVAKLEPFLLFPKSTALSGNEEASLP